MIWALNKYRDLIFGSKVIVYCDHNPLQYIRECAPKSAKLLRWSLALQELISTLFTRRVPAMWWQIGCPVSVVSTCVRNYLLWDLVVTMIVLTIVDS